MRKYGNNTINVRSDAPECCLHYLHFKGEKGFVSAKCIKQYKNFQILYCFLFFFSRKRYEERRGENQP